MAEYQEQPGANGSSASDETLRLYLLCRLGEDERLRLDERLLIDDGLAERLLLAESELTDDYIAGRFDAGEREFFEKSFLTTETRRQRLRFSSALHDYAGAQASPAPASHAARDEKPSWHEWLTGLFGFGWPRGWAVASSLAAVIMLVGVAWFVAKQRRDTVPVITRNEPIPTWSPQVSPRAEPAPSPVSPEPSQTTSRGPAAPPTPAERPAPARVASFVLLPGLVRSGGDLQRVALPDGGRDTVRLHLILETGAEGVYQAEVTTVEGEKVTGRGNLKAESRAGEAKLTIDIPARHLQSGDYQIKLTRQKADGQSETVGRYYFRALK